MICMTLRHHLQALPIWCLSAVTQLTMRPFLSDLLSVRPSVPLPTTLPSLTVTSLDKASPLGEGPLRNRPAAALGIPTVIVVKMTPLSFIPGAKITKYLGIINMFFIRETTSLREEGGVSGFLHAFICEVFAMVRAHVAALGGNAVVSYIMKQCVFMENTNKNQAQCLINVSGDAVIFTRESETDVTSSAALQQSSQTSAGEGT